MGTIYRYISLNFIRSFFIVLLVMSTLAWITQAIGYIDLFINKQRTLADFFNLTILIYPWVISLMIPASLVIAALMTMDKMKKDSETVILDSSGISIIQKVSPFIIVTLIITILLYFLTLYFAPWSMSQFRDNINSIKSDVISSSFKKNQFSSPKNDYTIYVSEKTDANNFIGIMIKDSKSNEITVTYTAKKARIISVEEQIILEMYDGMIFSKNKNDKESDLNRISFESYRMNLSNILEFTDIKHFKLREKSLGELFDAISEQIEFDNSPIQIKNELHSRLSSPLYAIAFIFISLFYLQKDTNFRNINLKYFFYVGSICFLLKFLGIILTNELLKYELYLLHYSLPVSVICLYITYLFLSHIRELRHINAVIK